MVACSECGISPDIYIFDYMTLYQECNGCLLNCMHMEV
jgi:hypothetical protein